MKRGKLTKQKILDAGLKIWHIDPSNISTRKIGEMIGMSHCTVAYHYPDGKLKDAIAAYGISKGDSVVVVSLILTGHHLVDGMSVEEKQKHLNALH